MTRKQIIAALEKKRKSKVLCYITGDRPSIPPVGQIPGLTTRLATDSQTIIHKHLKSMGKVNKIDLFLYTRGGNTNCVWPLVNLIREYCKEFNVLVPFRAHSAGTMIALGANKIILTEASELSPIDPTTYGPFHPKSNPADPNSQPLGISVEDVAYFIKLARNGEPRLKREESILKMTEHLTSAIHPLVLGNIYRVYNQIRLLAGKLLLLHLPANKNIKPIVNYFVEELYSHDHAISRKEASQILGNLISYADKEETELMDQLLGDISKELNLDEPFNLKVFMGSEADKELEIKGALLESKKLKYVYKTKMKITQRPSIPSNTQIQIPPGQQLPAIIPGLPSTINIDVLSMGWGESR